MKDLKSEHLILPSQRAWLSLKDCHAPENKTWTFLTKINSLDFGVEFLPILNAESICLGQNIYLLGHFWTFFAKYLPLILKV